MAGIDPIMLGIINAKIKALEISTAGGLTSTIVSSLPATGENNKIYIITEEVDGTTVSKMHMYIEGVWHLVGTSELDISGGGSGLNTEAKNALIDCLMHVAWTDTNGQARLERLQTALGIETPEPTQLIINGIDLSWERGYIDANGGLAIARAANGSYTSDFYTVNNYKTETINLENAEVYRHAFYDLNKSFIMRTTDNDTSNKTVEIPDNAVYARATIVKTSLGNDGYNGDGTTITLTKDGE